MRALIYRRTSSSSPDELVVVAGQEAGDAHGDESDGDGIATTMSYGAIPIAGVPLVLRQLQWLHSVGIHDVTVALGRGPADDALHDLLQHDTLGRQAHIVRTPSALDPRTLVRTAGLELPLLLLPDDTIGDGDLAEMIGRSAECPCVFTLAAPALDEGADRLEEATVATLGSQSGPAPIRKGLGWGARIRDFEAARILGRAVLLGQLPARDDEHRWPLIVHARETRPGVWLARGVSVARGAQLEPPVFIGRDAIVVRDARVGPDVFVGERASIGRHAQVRASFVAPGTLVGEGVELERAVAYPDRIHSLDDASDERRIDDPRILTGCDSRFSSIHLPRIMTFLFLLGLALFIWLLIGQI